MFLINCIQSQAKRRFFFDTRWDWECAFRRGGLLGFMTKCAPSQANCSFSVRIRSRLECAFRRGGLPCLSKRVLTLKRTAHFVSVYGCEALHALQCENLRYDNLGQRNSLQVLSHLASVCISMHSTLCSHDTHPSIRESKIR